MLLEMNINNKGITRSHKLEVVSTNTVTQKYLQLPCKKQ